MMIMMMMMMIVVVVVVVMVGRVSDDDVHDNDEGCHGWAGGAVV